MNNKMQQLELKHCKFIADVSSFLTLNIGLLQIVWLFSRRFSVTYFRINKRAEFCQLRLGLHVLSAKYILMYAQKFGISFFIFLFD